MGSSCSKGLLRDGELSDMIKRGDVLGADAGMQRWRGLGGGVAVAVQSE